MYFQYYPIYIIFSIPLAVSKFDAAIFFCLFFLFLLK